MNPKDSIWTCGIFFVLKVTFLLLKKNAKFLLKFDYEMTMLLKK